MFSLNFWRILVLSKRNSIWKLKTIDFSSTENHLPNSLLSVGSIACKIVKKFKEMWRDHVRIFKQSNNCLFKVCCLYGWKITAEQWFSETVTAIDPDSILAKWTATLKAILHLPDIVTNVLSSTDLEDYEKECRKIMVDPALLPALVEKKFVRADIWWFKLY